LDDGDLKSANKALKNWRDAVSQPVAEWDRLSGDLEYSRGDRGAAAKSWVRYTELAPKAIDGWQRLAGVYEELGKIPEALAAMDHVVELASWDASQYISRAKLKMRARDWDGAAKDVREANRLDATNAAVQELFPIFEESAPWLTEAKQVAGVIEKFPDDYESRLDEAELLISKGLGWLAVEDVEIALKANPEAIRTRLLYKLALRKPHASGEGELLGTAEAVSKYRAQLRHWDQHPDPAACAQFCYRNGLPLLALHYAQGVDGSVITANVLYDQDRFKEAGIAARRATEVHPNDAEAWLVLGRVNLANGNLQDAVTCFDKSNKLHKTEMANALRAEALRRQSKK
jgi:tetratricopeptide (TPR) repeat protein